MSLLLTNTFSFGISGFAGALGSTIMNPLAGAVFSPYANSLTPLQNNQEYFTPELAANSSSAVFSGYSWETTTYSRNSQSPKLASTVTQGNDAATALSKITGRLESTTVEISGMLSVFKSSSLEVSLRNYVSKSTENGQRKAHGRQHRRRNLELSAISFQPEANGALSISKQRDKRDVRERRDRERQQFVILGEAIAKSKDPLMLVFGVNTEITKGKGSLHVGRDDRSVFSPLTIYDSRLTSLSNTYLPTLREKGGIKADKSGEVVFSLDVEENTDQIWGNTLSRVSTIDGSLSESSVNHLLIIQNPELMETQKVSSPIDRRKSNEYEQVVFPLMRARRLVAAEYELRRIPDEIKKALRSHGEKNPLVVDREIQGRKFRGYYAENDGKLLFAGWHEISDSSKKAKATQLYLTPPPVLLRSEVPVAYGLGTPGGETAYKYPYFEQDGVSVEERLTSLIMDQLKGDPTLLENEYLLNTFNAYLAATEQYGFGSHLSKKEWEELVSESLTLAVRHVPAFGSSGLRTRDEINSDILKLLDLDVDQYTKWTSFFNVDPISTHIMSDELLGANSGQLKSIKEQLSFGLDRQLGQRANVILGGTNSEFGIPRPDEMSMQWLVARMSEVRDSEERVEFAKNILGSFLRRGNTIVAGRVISLIISHSVLNEFPSEKGQLSRRWSKLQLSALLREFVKDEGWNSISGRLRRHISEQQQKALNKVIYSANYENAIDEMRAVDVTKISDDEFWRMVDATGYGDVMIDEVIRRMAAAVQ